MLYRPNFCSYCGEKIERARWPILASRRFCDLCQTDHQTADWAPRIAVILALAFGAAGIVALYRPAQHAENVSFKASSQSGATSTPGQNNATPRAISQSQTVPDITESQRSPSAPPFTLKGAPKVTEVDAVYYCGAATKKGTPCTRRVKRAGERCWQHQGMPAMAENAQKIMR